MGCKTSLILKFCVRTPPLEVGGIISKKLRSLISIEYRFYNRYNRVQILICYIVPYL